MLDAMIDFGRDNVRFCQLFATSTKLNELARPPCSYSRKLGVHTVSCTVSLNRLCRLR